MGLYYQFSYHNVGACVCTIRQYGCLQRLGSARPAADEAAEDEGTRPPLVYFSESCSQRVQVPKYPVFKDPSARIQTICCVGRSTLIVTTNRSAKKNTMTSTKADVDEHSARIVVCVFLWFSGAVFARPICGFVSCFRIVVYWC